MVGLAGIAPASTAYKTAALLLSYRPLFWLGIMVLPHCLLRIRKVFYFYTNSQYGGLGRSRTDDRSLKRRVLDQTSFGPVLDRVFDAV